MKTRMLGRFLMTVVLVASADVAGAASTNRAYVPQGDDAIAKAVRHEIVMYPRYSIWDDVSFRVADGQVELTGAVSQPYKKEDIGRLAAKVPGVVSVTNDLKVLPLSPFDDRLRLQVGRAIYSDPSLRRYATMALPPIHIIVENGHVTLDGVVNNNLEKQIAGMRAASVGLSFGPVVNNLQVENQQKKS